MKKATLAALAILLPGSAFGYAPSIGDTSIYDLETVTHGAAIQGEYAITVTTVDRATDTLTQSVRVKMLGANTTHALTLKLSQYEKEAATRAERIENCAQYGGVPELLATPAGQFRTCKMPVKTQDITGLQWIADVPAGYVKYVSQNGDTTTTQVLREFHRGR